MSCDILKGSTGVDRILLTLAPGVPQTVTWDFRGCLDGKGNHEPITEFTIMVTQPRQKNLALRALKPGAVRSQYTLGDSTDSAKVVFLINHYYVRLGTVTNELVTLQLTNTTNRPIDVEVTTSLIIGG